VAPLYAIAGVMRILFTGASSFTGYWFVKALAESGHEVVAPLRAAVASYSGVRRQRVDRLSSIACVVEECPFGSRQFLDLASEGFDLLCHHAATVSGYKSEQFDICAAVQNNTCNLPLILEKMGGRHLALTGSLFESGEGRGTNLDTPFSPYGLSKQISYQIASYQAEKAGVVVGKFVIPNPFGPLEEARFTSYLARCWAEGRVAVVQTPDYIRDNIHVSLLALAYRDFIQKLVVSPSKIHLGPSGYQESQGAFARRFAKEMEKRLPYPCPLEMACQDEFSEPLERVNVDRIDAKRLGWSESQAWDELANAYLEEVYV